MAKNSKLDGRSDMSEDTKNKRFSTHEILEIGRDLQKSDKWHGATYDTAKLLCDEIERLARIEWEYETAMKILRDVKLYPSSLNPRDDDFGRPSGDEMLSSYRAVCRIRMLFPESEGSSDAVK